MYFALIIIAPLPDRALFAIVIGLPVLAVFLSSATRYRLVFVCSWRRVAAVGTRASSITT